MAAKQLKWYQKPFILLALSGLLGLVVWIIIWMWFPSPKNRIVRACKRAGYSEDFGKVMAAVSAHETNGWTSNVYKEGHNLFGMTLASRNTLAIGVMDNAERSAKFKSDADSVEDFIMYLTIRFNYPKDLNSIEDIVRYMKEKGYFTDQFANYYNGVKSWYIKLWE